jgi:hypothetical protein
MEYVLYINLSNPSSIYREAECNKGIDTVLALLDDLRRRGESVQIRNTAEMSKEELMTAYMRDAAVAAVYGKYRVRTVFGSNRQPGSAFGQGVPALSVRDLSAETAPNVYPHNSSGRYVTICEFLTQLLANPVKPQADAPEKSNGHKRRRTRAN